MKVNLKYGNYDVSDDEKKLISNFVTFLKKKLPLKSDIVIEFVKKRVGSMTTGSRSKDHHLKILVKDRLNRDILRTIAHEWDHEYQRTILKRDKGPDIGGKNEDDANSKAGELLKKFESKHKSSEKTIYSTFTERMINIESLINENTISGSKLINEIKKYPLISYRTSTNLYPHLLMVKQ